MQDPCQLVQPQELAHLLHHAKLMPTSGASRVGTLVATHARLMPTPAAPKVGTILALGGPNVDTGGGD